MPVIVFQNLDAVRAALAAGAVPPSLARRPARVGYGADGRVWIHPGVTVPRAAAGTLTLFGTALHDVGEPQLTEEVGSWLELVPLVPAPVNPDDRPSPVLFDLPDPSRLPALVAEVRRLGAGQVGLRWLDPLTPNGESRGLALVASPPFHSLLRDTPRPFARQGPRLWVEVGWRHPLAEMIEPPVGRAVLIRAPRSWELIDDGPFPSGTEDLVIPHRPAAADAMAHLALSVALRLTADHSPDPPELWMLRGQPLDRLRGLAEQCDDRLLSRLTVAVGAADGEQVAVLRATPGRAGPPVLVIDALACRPFLRLPNLYLPMGTRLRPPLRRDAVRRLLVPDAAAVVWLEPSGGGGFTPHSLPEAAFRPLEQAVSYLQDFELQTLTPLTGVPPFGLLSYTAREPSASPARRRPAATPAEPPPAPTPEPADEPGLFSRIVRWFTPRHDEPAAASQTAAAPAAAGDEPPRALAASDEQRRALEERLLAAIATPDNPGRQALWPDLARLYAALNRPADAAVCWLNALWEADDPPSQWSRGWLRAETRAARGDGSEADLRRWLAEPPTPAAVRAVAAIAGSSAGEYTPTGLAGALDRVQRLLDEHEDWLPIRAAWLARVGLTRLTGGDVVGLARTRDRLLERLHARGLSADLDVPAAVRFAGQGAGERAEAVRAWMARARGQVHRWLAGRSTTREAEGLTTVHDPRLQVFGLGGASAGPTRAYADLILAWGLARLGERGTCEDLLSQARGALARPDAAHAFLLDAFAFRIAQALEGRGGGPLPAGLLTRLAELEGRERADHTAREQALLLKVNRLRQASRILEPAERVAAFSEGWLAPHADVDPALAGLRSVGDRDELARRLLPAVASAGRDPSRLPAVLAAALDLAPRLGESVAGGILERLLATVGTWSFAGPAERVEVETLALERGLFVAGHFDRADAVQRLLTHLNRLMEARRGGDPGENRPAEDALLALVGQGLRGLRRFGLRAEADQFLDRLGEWVAAGGDLAAERRRRPQAWPLTLRRLLVLAGGWFYVGRDSAATEVLDEARRVLFAPEPAADVRHHRTDLACAYAAALGQAPVRLALARVDEMFQRLPSLSDTLTTNTHYSLAKLRLIETTVLAVVTDDFALGPAVRRWLDDDEYRVRRRIHGDTRALLGAGESSPFSLHARPAGRTL